MKLQQLKFAWTRRGRGNLVWVCVATALGLAAAAYVGPGHAQQVSDGQPRAGQQFVGTPAEVEGAAVVNFSELAKAAALTPPVEISPQIGVSPLNPRPFGEVSPELPQEVKGQEIPVPALVLPLIASPAAALNFAGLDDIADAFTGFVWTPPDTDGAVGLAEVMEGLNNNYRIQNKATGLTISTISTYSFWASTGRTNFFDPKTLYDPINNRWIVVILSGASSTNSSIHFGVSQTADPTGNYFLFSVRASTGADWADFPCVGFNRNWVAINVNMFPIAGGGSTGSKMLVVDYAQLRGGTASSVFITTGPGFCSSPAATYSATENTLYVVKHLSGPAGTYRLDTITGTPGAPVYTVGASRNRGITWAEPAPATINNILPQAAPLVGVSFCGATPCKLETQDSQIRSTPVVRGGVLYYAQTIGLPTGGLTHTAVQWTELDASGGATTGNVVDGGRVEDATATASNGGKWYAYPHIAANQFGDIILGFSQFSSTQYASAGYSYHHRTDGAGVMRDPVIYQAGLDYFRKDFNGSGRYRWGDYSKAQVDPSNDADLWVLQEYAKARVGSDDSAGTNTSRWGTWWARVGCVITCPSNITQTNDPGLCGAVVNYPAPTNSGPCGPVTTTPASGSFFPVGTTTVTSSDTTGASCTFTITVNDVEPPKVTSSVERPMLWPPDHNLANVGLTATATDNCDGTIAASVAVFGNEDDEMPTGDGIFSPDAIDLASGTLRLREERRGDGAGRVYLIVSSARDKAGNSNFTASAVVVPQNLSKPAITAVNAQAAAAVAYCLANNGAPPPGYFLIGDGLIIGPKQ